MAPPIDDPKIILSLTIFIFLVIIIPFTRALIKLSFIFFPSNKRRHESLNPTILDLLRLNSSAIYQQMHRVHTKILDRRGCTFVFSGPWLLNMDMLVTADPANVQYILGTNSSNFPKGSNFQKIFDILGDGIFGSDLDSWLQQRKFARDFFKNPDFHHFSVKALGTKLETGLVPILDQACNHGKELDLQDLFQRYFFDYNCMAIAGYDPNSLSVELPEVSFPKALHDAEEAIIFRHLNPESTWKFQRWLGVGQERKLSNAWKTLDKIIANYISMKREELAKGVNGEKGFDLLTSYMKEDAVASNDKFLRDVVLNFMFAGMDGPKSAITWFFWLLSKNPEVEDKILEELKANLPSNEANNNKVVAGMEEVNKLVYLHAALCETLRLYPSVPFQHKSPLKPDVLPSGHHVHPRMKIIISIYAMGRMQSVWGQDCLDFKPERWISEEGRFKNESAYKFMAFNAGPRICLGKEMSFTQMKMVAATIIRNYHVEVAKGHPVVPSLSIILSLEHGLKVRITKRA